MDAITAYAASRGWTLKRNIVVVEGSTDEALFKLASYFASRVQVELLGQEISIVAAGERDLGGTFGVGRELITLRSMAASILDARGDPMYRVIGVVDDDHAGRKVIADIANIDRGVLEFRDILRLRPVMPVITGADPQQLRAASNLANLPFGGLDWEVEDVLSGGLLAQLAKQQPADVLRRDTRGGRTHHELTKVGKRELHKLVQRHAVLADLGGVVGIIRTLRAMFGLPDAQLPQAS